MPSETRTLTRYPDGVQGWRTPCPPEASKGRSARRAQGQGIAAEIREAIGAQSPVGEADGPKLKKNETKQATHKRFILSELGAQREQSK